MKAVKSEITPQLASDMREGMNGRFWTALRSIVEDEIQDIEEKVFEDENLTDKQRDDLRRWRNFLKYFIGIPEEIVKKSEMGKTEEVEFDPFPKVREGIVGKYE